jgi:hypothetical protein
MSSASTRSAPRARLPRSLPAATASVGRILGHSLLPFAALAIIAGTLLWGPWVSLVLALVWWKVVTRIG